MVNKDEYNNNITNFVFKSKIFCLYSLMCIYVFMICVPRARFL